MCNQAVSLMAAELERRGIATVSILLLRWVAERVRPPRALCVPFPHGRPLGAALDATGQRHVLEAALELLETAREPATLIDYEAADGVPRESESPV
jgi:hypothetical protein